MKLHGALTIFVMVPSTLTTNNNGRTRDLELRGDFVKPLMNNGNTIKPVKNNVNNVYNVYVEQHHVPDNEEKKDGKDVEKKIEVLGTAGVVSEESDIFCPN